MYDIRDPKNLEILADMIAFETTGSDNAVTDQKDMDLALITAGFIKQIITDTYADGCIIKGDRPV